VAAAAAAAATDSGEHDELFHVSMAADCAGRQPQQGPVHDHAAVAAAAAAAAAAGAAAVTRENCEVVNGCVRGYIRVRELDLQGAGAKEHELGKSGVQGVAIQ
jgi:hypothetical protein